MSIRRAFPLALAALLAVGCNVTVAPGGTAGANTAAATTDDVLARAFARQQGDLQVRGSGTVARLLPDDNDGSRHQRFILALDSGQTLLVAHNIDLAPRIAGLAVGDVVEFNGEYEWNDRGGTLHWTHHDPQGRHEGGWLRHKGRTYE